MLLSCRQIIFAFLKPNMPVSVELNNKQDVFIAQKPRNIQQVPVEGSLVKVNWYKHFGRVGANDKS